MMVMAISNFDVFNFYIREAFWKETHIVVLYIYLSAVRIWTGLNRFRITFNDRHCC